MPRKKTPEQEKKQEQARRAAILHDYQEPADRLALKAAYHAYWSHLPKRKHGRLNTLPEIVEALQVAADAAEKILYQQNFQMRDDLIVEAELAGVTLEVKHGRKLRWAQLNCDPRHVVASMLLFNITGDRVRFNKLHPRNKLSFYLLAFAEMYRGNHRTREDDLMKSIFEPKPKEEVSDQVRDLREGSGGVPVPGNGPSGRTANDGL